MKPVGFEWTRVIGANDALPGQQRFERHPGLLFQDTRRNREQFQKEEERGCSC